MDVENNFKQFYNIDVPPIMYLTTYLSKNYYESEK